MPGSSSNQMDGPNRSSQKTDSASHHLIPALGTLTTAIAKSAIAWGAVKRGKTRLEQHNPAMREVRRICLERRREKEPLKRKKLVHCTVQSSTGDAT